MNLKQNILELINRNIRNKNPKVKKTEHADVEEALLNAIFIPFQVFEIDCSQDFIDNNFDLAPGLTMGLGKNEMNGFAMCNGNNGTRDRRKRVSVGYDPTAYVAGNNYSIIGNEFGEENHQLTIEEMPAHNHEMDGDYNENNENGPNVISGGIFSNRKASTKETGGGKPHSIVQPSIVTLYVQRTR